MTAENKVKAKQEKTWRYLIESSWGKHSRVYKRGVVVLMDRYYGRRYDWTIYHLPDFQPIGGFSGSLVASKQ